MPNGKSYDIWEQRWKNLDTALTDTVRWCESLPVSRVPTLSSLIKSLQAFGRSQFYFFYNGVKTDSPYTFANFQPEHAFSVILDQIAIDLNCLQLAATQRVIANSNPAWRETLEKADRFAWRCLPYAEQGSDKTDTTAITYFQKFPSIRVIPYAPVALIGIPFSCATVPQDYLAIPHEVGHYMYWHKFRSKFSTELSRLANDDARFVNELNHWAEEIFADVYGCSIAGPVIAADFQDLQLRFSEEEFVVDDGEHPVPAIRPMIYRRILQTLQERNSELAKPYRVDAAELTTLDERWQQKLRERELESVDGSNFTVAKLSSATKQPTLVSFPGMEKVILAALNVLRENIKSTPEKFDPVLSQRWWVNGSSQDGDLNRYALDLYQQFGANLLAMDSQPPRELVVKETGADLSDAIKPIPVSVVDLEPNSKTSLTPLWVAWAKNEYPLLGDPENIVGQIAAEENNKDGSKQRAWKPVLSASDWGTKGPHGRK
jgi:hypothetical protein